MVNRAEQTLRNKYNTKCRTHRNGEPREKRRLDPPGGEGAAITHWTCWLERERVATHKVEHQGQTAQVKQRLLFVRFQEEQV